MSIALIENILRISSLKGQCDITEGRVLALHKAKTRFNCRPSYGHSDLQGVIHEQIQVSSKHCQVWFFPPPLKNYYPEIKNLDFPL